MRDHAVAFKHRRVFDIDAVFDKDKIEHAVLIDVAVQHDQEFVTGTGGMLDLDGYLPRSCLC